MLKKLLTLALMIIAPIVSGKAFYEYVQVAMMHKKPAYPFGKAWMKTIQETDLSYVATYERELLTIGIVFLIITVIAYISMMIRTLMNMIWLALLLFVAYMLYHYLVK